MSGSSEASHAWGGVTPFGWQERTSGRMITLEWMLPLRFDTPRAPSGALRVNRTHGA